MDKDVFIQAMQEIHDAYVELVVEEGWSEEQLSDENRDILKEAIWFLSCALQELRTLRHNIDSEFNGIL